jgi:SAM-dependent methyltransferase
VWCIVLAIDVRDGFTHAEIDYPLLRVGFSPDPVLGPFPFRLMIAPGSVPRTLHFYERNSARYAEDTLRVDMADEHSAFLSYLAPGSLILDTGCGAGRDSRAFLDLGHTVRPFDGSPAMAAVASQHLGIPVGVLLHQEVSFDAEFDAVWAYATLLHLHRTELVEALKAYVRALRPGGILYASFKMGSTDGEDAQCRWFTYMERSDLRQLLAFVPGTEILEMREWEDQMGRKDTRWLAVIVRRVPE